MISILSKLFIKDRLDFSAAAVRTSYGILCGITGIVLNIFLFAIKFFAGLISGSVAVTADAFNNLSDAGSSVISLIGFKLASQKPDKDHPFGHGRFEYISGLIVSLIILLMGVELAKDSFSKILSPEAVETSALTVRNSCCLNLRQALHVILQPFYRQKNKFSFHESYRR